MSERTNDKQTTKRTIDRSKERTLRALQGDRAVYERIAPAIAAMAKGAQYLGEEVSLRQSQRRASRSLLYVHCSAPAHLTAITRAHPSIADRPQRVRSASRRG